MSAAGSAARAAGDRPSSLGSAIRPVRCRPAIPYGAMSLSKSSRASGVPATITVSASRPNVDDAPAEHTDELDDLRALACVGRDAHEQQLGLARLVGMELADLDDVDELVELRHDLLERRRLDVDDDR